jgi:hypothetical protein
MPPPPRPQSERLTKSNSSSGAETKPPPAAAGDSKPPSMMRAHSDGGVPFPVSAGDDSSDSEGEMIQPHSPDAESTERW